MRAGSEAGVAGGAWRRRGGSLVGGWVGGWVGGHACRMSRTLVGPFLCCLIAVARPAGGGSASAQADAPPAHMHAPASAEELAGRLDELFALKSELLRRKAAPHGVLLAHSSAELAKWEPAHVSHFLRVMGVAAAASTVHADVAMAGPAFGCWLRRLHAAHRSPVVGDEHADGQAECAAAIAAHPAAFSAVLPPEDGARAQLSWVGVHRTLLSSPLGGLQMMDGAATAIDCRRRHTHAAAGTERLTAVLRHCGVVIVAGLLPQSAAVQQQLKSLPRFAGSAAAVTESCAKAGGAAAATTGDEEPMEDKLESEQQQPQQGEQQQQQQQQPGMLGSLRGGRREEFLPLADFTSELPMLMHHQPLTSILRSYLAGLGIQPSENGSETAMGSETAGAVGLQLELDSVVLVDNDPGALSSDQANSRHRPALCHFHTLSAVHQRDVANTFDRLWSVRKGEAYYSSGAEVLVLA